MMLVGAVGTKAVPPEYFGIVERFSVFAAAGFTAVLGLFLFLTGVQPGTSIIQPGRSFFG